MATRPRVVIVGAGFGGLTCARALRRAQVSVTLVDRNNYHLFSPLVYQVATATLDPAEVARPVRSLVARNGNVEFRLTDVKGVDLDGRRLQSESGEIPYDYLVLAAGSKTDYFGNPSLAERCFELKSLPDALGLRNHVLRCFEAASLVSDPDMRRRMLTFVVVGGGPTGVEYAGALSELVRLITRRDFTGVDLGPTSIRLLEGAPYLLGAFEPSLRAAGLRDLRRKGVEVSLGSLVRDVGEGSVELADGSTIAADTVVWTAGVAAVGLGAALGLPVDRHGRVLVDASLRVPERPEVFVIGDLSGAVAEGGAVAGVAPAGAGGGGAAGAAGFGGGPGSAGGSDADGGSDSSGGGGGGGGVGGALPRGVELPMLIPVAMQQGHFVAEAIGRLVRGQEAGRFRYHDPGILATIGRFSGLAQLRHLRLSGFLGWVTWLVVHLAKVTTFRSRLIVLVNWTWDFVFNDRPIRLIVAATDRDVAPHGSPGTLGRPAPPQRGARTDRAGRARRRA